ncbi:hypothetical protein [Flavobacterium hungaricum]|uniref:Uncharacterized protein n=1 Tax=Flavobacterium hungaricum TaxID=2082725 RepID=A0ABR9TRV4_9FLAO|nr:hypothetical protein [Flavobacterium hungaricum]MBE8728090.1 hypothetical protein [Flavobacterium hungaricum]
MRNLLSLLLLFVFQFNFSQLNTIDKNRLIPRNIDFKGCVKNITLTEYQFNKSDSKVDTTKMISQTVFSKKGKVAIVKLYPKLLNDFTRIIELDSLERIKTVLEKKEGAFEIFIRQYFGSKTEFPDSTFINNDNYKEKYVNHFKNNLVVKQEHFVNDSLIDNRLYKYNKQNQLTEELYLNPENPTGESVVFKSENQLSFYPNRQVIYEYKKIKDTLIISKIHPDYNNQEVIKKIKKPNYTLEITEEYDKSFLLKSRFLYTAKDSISDITYYYKGKKEIRDYYKTFTTPKTITSKWKMQGDSSDEEKNSITTIDTLYDERHNWIKKTYTSNNTSTYIRERKIEYYCD